MNRYTKSFSITFIVYLFVFASIILNANILSQNEFPKENILKIQTITQTQIAQVQKIEPKIEQPISRPKQIKPEPIKQEIAPTKIHQEVVEIPKQPKQILAEETPKQTQSIIKEAPKPQVVENQKPTQIEVATKIAEPKQVIIQEVKIDNTAIKQKFFSELKQKINSNKFYPQNAKRRGIEGIVEVKFEILSSGQIGTINIISGNQIFFQSTKEAIESSFPMAIPAQIKDNLGFVTVSLEYKLL